MNNVREYEMKKGKDVDSDRIIIDLIWFCYNISDCYMDKFEKEASDVHLQIYIDYRNFASMLKARYLGIS